MQEHGPCASAQATNDTSSSSARAGWADLRSLVILAILVVSLRCWQISHTEVASRDSISYIRIAWQLGHGDWREVLPRSPQHPAYPLTVLALAKPLSQWFPDDLPRAWQVSAQTASALASLLLIVPMYYLGRELFDRRVAFWACVLFQCLPSSGKVMADGLSDTLFLLFACCALWLACLALRRGSRIAFALSGLAGGLAYLTRPEGALIIGVTGLVLLGVQLNRHWRRSWRVVFGDGVALSLAALAVMLPYMIVIGGITVKNTPNLMMNQQRPDADWENRLRPQANGKAQTRNPHSTASGSTLLAIWFGPGQADFESEFAKIKDLSELQNAKTPSRYVWALKALYVELGKGFFYAAWLPVLLGLWWFRDRFRRVPGAWVLLIACLTLIALLYRVAEKMGYLSDRHLLLVILCASYWAVAATLVLGEKFALGLSRLRPALAGRRWADARTWSVALLLLLTLAPLPRTLQSLHAERAGFRTVGKWLAEHIPPGDWIEDPYCWAYYYAGRVFLEGCAGLTADQPPCFYVVLEASKNRHPHLVSLQRALVHAMEAKGSKKVHQEAIRRGKENVSIQVYRVPGVFQNEALPGLPGQRK
jgi:hypothetical protein